MEEPVDKNQILKSQFQKLIHKVQVRKKIDMKHKMIIYEGQGKEIVNSEYFQKDKQQKDQQPLYLIITTKALNNLNNELKKLLDNFTQQDRSNKNYQIYMMIQLKNISDRRYHPLQSIKIRIIEESYKENSKNVKNSESIIFLICFYLGYSSAISQIDSYLSSQYLSQVIYQQQGMYSYSQVSQFYYNHKMISQRDYIRIKQNICVLCHIN